MANLRYIFLIALVMLAAVLGVLWQEDDTPTITFTRPPTVNDDATGSAPSMLDSAASGVTRSGAGNHLGNHSAIVPMTDSDRASSLRSEEYTEQPLEETLTEEQLAEKIQLAQVKLARVEAMNARKQAHVQQMMAESGRAEQSLIEAELAYQIGGWRHAWRTGDAHTYFEFYSASFKPSNGKSQEQWKAQRVKRLNPGKPIDLTLTDFNVSVDPETKRSLVTFTQRYQSGDYQDITKKRLIMAEEQGQWKIVSETTQ